MKDRTGSLGTPSRALSLVVGSALFLSPFSGAAFAQDDFADCQRKAREESGYTGRAPKKGNVLGDAAKGAALGAIVAGIRGKDRSKGARKGAAAGALLGGMQRSSQQKKQAKLQKAYEVALEECMNEAAARVPQTDPLAAAGESAFDLESMTSWDVLSASSDDRASVLLLLYGYVAGQRYEAVQSPTKIEGTLGSFKTYAQPTEKPAIAAVSQAMSSVTAGPSSEEFNLAKLTCWDLNLVSDDVYPYLSVLAYGYAAGQLGDSVQSPDKIARTIQGGGNVCQEMVGMEIVDVYRKSLTY